MRIRNLINENRSRKISVTLIFVTVAALIVGAPHLNYVSAKKDGGGALRGHADKQSADSTERSLRKAVGSRGFDPMARLLDGGVLDEHRAAALKKLSVKRRSGVPFAIQEIEILDAFEAGLPIAIIEADIVISRALYDVYVAGKPPSNEQRELLARYCPYNTEHSRELVARNAQLNAEFAWAQGTSEPDGSREWELYSDPELYNQLPSGLQFRLQAKFGHKGKVRTGKVGAGQHIESPASVQAALPNTLVNNPAADLTTQDTQSGTAIVLGSGSNILTAFNDSGSNVGSAAHFTGIARSTDAGNTFTDNGTLPTSAVGDAGSPVLARSTTTGTVILATLPFNSNDAIQTYRSVDNGATYLSPIDADGGGALDGNAWLACDNFAGAGQGNLYLLYRDLGSPGGMSFTRSTDDGITWSSRQLLTSDDGFGSWVAVGADHAVYIYYIFGVGGPVNTIVQRKSIDRGLTFGPQTTVVTLRTTGSIGDLGLNGGFRTNAFPQVVANPNDANQLYMTWNDKAVTGPDKANIYFSQTTNAGVNWSTPIQLNTDLGTNDNWMPCIAITADGTGLFVSWYDRRLDAANNLIDVFGRNATISGTTVTFGNDYRLTDTAFPVVIGQDGRVVPTYMGDYDTAVADNSFYYRTWGDNRLPHGIHANQPDVRFTKIPKSGPGAIVAAAGASLTAESCTPSNGAPDPNEVVTMSLSVINVGTDPTTNLVGTLQATGGVTGPFGPATYGVIAPGGSASQNFTFTASGLCGGTITASLQLQDGATNLGTVTYTFLLGTAVMQTFSNPANITINDNAAGTPYPSDITVSGVSSYSRITVTFTGLSHTFPSDIDIILVAPGGQKAYVMSDVGGGADIDAVNLSFDDNATTALGTETITSGTYKPSNSDTTSDIFPPPAPPGSYSTNFSVFNSLGAGVNGTWSLYVRDDAGTDNGNIAGGWAINVVNALCSSCTVINTYTWNQTGIASYTTATNWTPARNTPAPDDILVFNNGAATAVTDVPTETIGQLLISGNSGVTLQTAAATTLTIAGNIGTDLSVAGGSELTFKSATPLTMNVASGATGSISGGITLFAGTSRLTAADVGGITFQSGAIFTAGSLFSGNPFGTTNLNSIIFANGSKFVSLGGSDPFGAAQPNSVVVFQSGSLYSHQRSSAPSASGRTYADFELRFPGHTISLTGSAALVVNNLLITAGTLNYNLTGIPGHAIKGDISIAGDQALNFNPASSGAVNLNGTLAQTISGAGTLTLAANQIVNINNANGVFLQKDVTLNGSLLLTSGDLNTGANILTMPATASSGPATGATDVVGNIRRTGFVSGGAALNFGNPNNTIQVNSGLAPADVTVNLVKASPSDFGNAIIRTYTITQNGGSGMSATARFHYRNSELRSNSEAGLTAWRKGAGGWTNQGRSNNFNDTLGDDNWVERDGITSFSPWTLASSTPTAAPANISGIVTTAAGAPLAGVTVKLSGARATTAITDRNGKYSFSNVDTNNFYSVTPQLANYHFTPEFRSFSLLADKTDAIFTALPDAIVTTNAIDTNEYFVRQQYLDFLGREPDRGGLNFWVEALNQCAGDAACLRSRRIDVSAAFFKSREFQESGSFVYKLYQSALGRDVSYREFSADRLQVVGGPNLEASKTAFAAAFVQQAEFLQKYQTENTGASFVDALLQTVYDSTGADLSSGRANLLSRYDSGTTMDESRALVLRAVAENAAFSSATYNPSFVLMEYFGYLQRGKDQGGYDFWLDVLNNRDPGNYRGMVCAFLTSAEYQRRFGTIVTRDNADCSH